MSVVTWICVSLSSGLVTAKSAVASAKSVTETIVRPHPVVQADVAAHVGRGRLEIALVEGDDGPVREGFRVSPVSRGPVGAVD